MRQCSENVHRGICLDAARSGRLPINRFTRRRRRRRSFHFTSMKHGTEKNTNKT